MSLRCHLLLPLSACPISIKALCHKDPDPWSSPSPVFTCGCYGDAWGYHGSVMQQWCHLLSSLEWDIALPCHSQGLGRGSKKGNSLLPVPLMILWTSVQTHTCTQTKDNLSLLLSSTQLKRKLPFEEINLIWMLLLSKNPSSKHLKLKFTSIEIRKSTHLLSHNHHISSTLSYTNVHAQSFTFISVTNCRSMQKTASS